MAVATSAGFVPRSMTVVPSPTAPKLVGDLLYFALRAGKHLPVLRSFLDFVG